MSKNERLQALRVLLKVIQDKVPLTHALQAEDSPPLTKAICFGVCRHYFRLESLADKLLKKRPDSLDIWLLILMGLYQLQFLNKPEYATVQETVELTMKLKKVWAKGLVNAVLRRFCREKEDILGQAQNSVSYQYGHPEWLIERIKQNWPHDWKAILQANDEHPPMTLRVNRQRVSRDNYLKILQGQGIAAQPTTHSEVGIYLTEPCNTQELPYFAEGFVSVQDEAAQYAASLLHLEPNLRILDACCAPGGKTCHILESEPALNDCIAIDVEPKRIQRVKENLSRLQLQATLITADALQLGVWWNGKRFDRILLDAPCSATGVIRRHPDIKLLRSPQEINQVVNLQAQLLNALWPTLKVGGLFVYATCSILKEENELQMAAFCQRHLDCHMVPMPYDWGIERPYGRQILPGQSNNDGFYYCVLQKG